MGSPVPAVLIRRRWDVRFLDIIWPLHDVGVETAGDVPRDVAMERPDAGVVGYPLEDLVGRERLGF